MQVYNVGVKDENDAFYMANLVYIGGKFYFFDISLERDIYRDSDDSECILCCAGVGLNRYSEFFEPLCILEFGIDSKRLVLWGHSLGTVFALYGALDNDVAGVILQSPIKEIKSSAININDFFLRRIHLKMFSIFTSKIIEGMNFISKLNNMRIIAHKTNIYPPVHKSGNFAFLKKSITADIV